MLQQQARNNFNGGLEGGSAARGVAMVFPCTTLHYTTYTTLPAAACTINADYSNGMHIVHAN